MKNKNIFVNKCDVAPSYIMCLVRMNKYKALFSLPNIIEFDIIVCYV